MIRRSIRRIARSTATIVRPSPAVVALPAISSGCQRTPTNNGTKTTQNASAALHVCPGVYVTVRFCEVRSARVNRTGARRCGRLPRTARVYMPRPAYRRHHHTIGRVNRAPCSVSRENGCRPRKRERFEEETAATRTAAGARVRHAPGGCAVTRGHFARARSPSLALCAHAPPVCEL